MTAAAVKAQGGRDDSSLRLALLTLLGCCGTGLLPAASWLLAPCPLGNSQSSLLPDDQGLLIRACSDRTSGSDSKLKDGSFRSAVRKKFFTVRLSMGTDCPEKLWSYPYL